eukprot:evm.model.NODE_43896_length_5600_cov_15.623750.1
MGRRVALGESSEVGGEDDAGATADCACEEGEAQEADTVQVVVNHGLRVPVAGEEKGDGQAGEKEDPDVGLWVGGEAKEGKATIR